MSSDVLLRDNDQLPNEALKPYVASTDTIKELLKDQYGLTLTDIRPLNGYDDLNLHVKVSPAHCNPHLDQVSDNGYFLKVINFRDSQRPDYLDAQLHVMEHLLKKGVHCQATIMAINGDTFTKLTVQNKNGEDVSHLVSLRTFISGEILQNISLTPRFLYRLGQYVAELTSALEDFSHSFYETFDCTWSLNTVVKLTDIMYVVKDVNLRNVCEGVVQAFKDEVIPHRSGFRKSQIHGDLNEQNILVLQPLNKSGLSPLEADDAQVCGLLDFQDTALSYPLYDLAILVCYMLMTFSKVPLLDIPGYILAGYQSKLKLTESERLAFRTCVAARMVQSLVMGAYTHHMDPSNHYVLTTSKHGWQALETFWSADRIASETRWEQLVQSFKP
ncbi:hydroxylysine kinase-like isoform X2 [Biomphalaria glabrata]|nr:hydroxylysine kinase-like isoform X2 [Biomphalaria glabrata]